METVVFYILAGAAILSALLVVAGRRLVHSVLGLAAVALCVALLCAQLGASLPAAALALLYAGGVGLAFCAIAVLLNLPGEREGKIEIARTFVACAASAALLAQLGVSLWRWNSGTGNDNTGAPPTVVELSERLFDAYRLPLEVVALLLLAALVGAVLLTRREKNS